MSPNCIFCKIISGEAPSTKYFEDEEVFVFKDIKPAAKYHLLAVPKKHIDNVNSLTKDDIPLINKLVEHGKRVIEEQGGDSNNVLLGFHNPPFNTVSHLHLHLISPCTDLSLLSRVMFHPNSFWFSTVEAITDKLKK